MDAVGKTSHRKRSTNVGASTTSQQVRSREWSSFDEAQFSVVGLKNRFVFTGTCIIFVPHACTNA